MTSANPVVIQRYSRSPIAEASIRISEASACVAGGIGAATTIRHGVALGAMESMRGMSFVTSDAGSGA